MLPEYKTILYATDLTPNAAHAFRHAVAMARRFDAQIHLLHVLGEVEPAVLHDVSAVMGEDRLTDYELEHKGSVRQDIEQRLADFAREELADHPEDLQRVVATEVHHGNPVALILDTAKQLRADLIVMGSHGKGVLKHAFLGSVAEKVLRKARRPVLVIPLPPCPPI